MQPIFGEMLKMWSDMGYDLPMKEGRFWLENNFIQGFTPDGDVETGKPYKPHTKHNRQQSDNNKVEQLSLFVQEK